MKHSIIKDFMGFLNEALDTVATGDPGDLSTEVKFGFNFDSGKYAKADIPAESLTKLQAELVAPSNLVSLPKYDNQKTVLTLVASTSTLGLSAELRAKLQAEGYTITGNGNGALCAARLKTLESITVDYFCTRLKCTPVDLKTKIDIKKISRPNSGGGSTADEQKKFQYVSMKLEQTGDAIPEDRKITCNMKPTSRKGATALRTVNYVGYNADQFVMVRAGQKITLSFNPMNVPDMVYFKYKDLEFLSPFLGLKARPDYDKRQYENELNDPAKYPGLIDAINTEIKKVGGTLTVQTALADTGGFINNKFVVLPGPSQQGNKVVNFTFPITKDFAKDKLVIRVFSPLDTTAFTISSTC